MIVAWALIVGGVAILVVEKFVEAHRLRRCRPTSPLTHSIGIGLVQCLAMIPGVSRSGATILGAMSFGVDRKTAAEFSFFLAVPTLSGATALQLFKHWDADSRAASSAGSGSAPRLFRRRDRCREGLHRDHHALSASRPSPGTGSSPAAVALVWLADR